jgi:hypothetical protein
MVLFGKASSMLPRISRNQKIALALSLSPFRRFSCTDGERERERGERERDREIGEKEIVCVSRIYSI